MTLTDTQLILLQSHCPEYLDGVTFVAGDDNDLACVIARIADRVRQNGDLSLAFRIAQASPEGFFYASWEQYRDAYGAAPSVVGARAQLELLPS